MKESTRQTIKTHGLRIDRALHHYVYFTQYDRYVAWFLRAGRLVKKWFGRLGFSSRAFGMVFDRYHAKLLSESDAARLISVGREVDLGEQERVVPFRFANQVILSEPDLLAVMDCPCRKSRENPCLPLNVCIAAGPAARFWLEHGARHHARRISAEEALAIIRSERQRGHLTTAWFKVATGGRTGVFCSCCSCCCGGLEGMRIARSLKNGEELSNIIPSGYIPVIDPDLCRSCGECARVCMFEAVTLDAEGDPVRDLDKCFGCGLCEDHCEHGAIKLIVKDPDGLLPLNLDLLLEREGKT